MEASGGFERRDVAINPVQIFLFLIVIGMLAYGYTLWQEDRIQFERDQMLGAPPLAQPTVRVEAVPAPAEVQVIVATVVAAPVVPTAVPVTAVPARFRVANTGAAGVNIRESAGTGTPLKVLAEGTVLEDLGEQVQANGATWQKVKESGGATGYVASQFLAREAPLAAGATPAATGGRLKVANTGGDGVFLRTAPRLAERLSAWPDGAVMENLGEEASGDGLTWRKVKAPNGQVGYIPSQWLAPG